MTKRVLATQLEESITHVREVLEALTREKFVVRRGTVVKLV
ncbi:MAG: hypothetical protein AAB920_01770 [Patescibacteria group bacterium]